MAECNDLPGTINIGGEIIYLQGTSANMNLAFKGREYFQKVFKPRPGDECILRKYMYHSLESKQNLAFKGTQGLRDKKRLNEILEDRKKSLWASIKIPSNTVIKNNLTRYYYGIEAILGEIKKSDEPKDEPPYAGCEKDKELLDRIKADEDKMFKMLLQVTWYLLHPDEVPSDIQCDWAAVVAKMDDLTIGHVSEQLALPNSVKKKKAFNYFKQIDLTQFGAEPNYKSAVKKARAMLETPDSKDIMKNRLQQLLTLLSLKKYLKGADLMQLPSEENITGISKKIPSRLLGGGELPLKVAFGPLTMYLKTMFDPVYSILEKRKQDSDTLMAILLTLLHICNTIRPDEKSYGVYRIEGIPPEGLEWVRSQLINPAAGDKQNEQVFAKQLYYLSKLRLPVLTGEDGGLAPIVSTVKDVPYFQFGIVGHNLTYPDSSSDNSLFPENTLFLFITNSDRMVSFESAYKDIPTNFFTISYNDVLVDQATIPTKPIEYKGESKNVEDLITIDKNLACNQANILLGIFFLLRNRIPS